MISCVLLGALLGAIGGGALADRFGRRWVIIAAAALFVAGAIATALAPSVAWLIAGRLVVGAAIGVARLRKGRESILFKERSRRVREVRPFDCATRANFITNR